MPTVEELERDPTVVWKKEKDRRLCYIRAGIGGLKDLHVFDATTGTELETRPHMAVAEADFDNWSDNVLQGRA